MSRPEEGKPAEWKPNLLCGKCHRDLAAPIWSWNGSHWVKVHEACRVAAPRRVVFGTAIGDERAVYIRGHAGEMFETLKSFLEVKARCDSIDAGSVLEMGELAALQARGLKLLERAKHIVEGAPRNVQIP